MVAIMKPIMEILRAISFFIFVKFLVKSIVLEIKGQDNKKAILITYISLLLILVT
jgi:hypothetical protein